MKTSADHRHDGSNFTYFNTTQKPYLLLITLCALSLVLYSCGDNSTGGINGNGNGNGNGDEIGTEPTFANVGQLFQNHCTECHGAQGQSGVSLNSYDNVMGSEGNQYGINVVVSENAEGSPLVDKIEPGPQHGERMPLNGPYLSNDRIDQIKDWINNGAENN